MLVELLLNLPDAPEAGAVNVTFTPGMGPATSLTVTARGLANKVLIATDCGEELAFTVMLFGTPVIFPQISTVSKPGHCFWGP
jgi:hypothetical protein